MCRRSSCEVLAVGAREERDELSRSEIRYAPSADGLEIAYQVVGDGPVDLVFVSGFITHLDLSWQLPHFGWLEQLDGVARVITFDKRGTGLSDRSLGFGSLEERAADIGAVMDAAGSEHAFLHGVSEGGPMSILFAASVPERVDGLVLFGTGARFSRAADYPFGLPEKAGASFVDAVEAEWGSGQVFGMFIQNAPDAEAARDTLARFERNSCTPKMAAEIMRRNLEIDVRSALSAITAPTLVVHVTGDPMVPVASGRYLAEHIPDARFLELPGDFHGSWRPGDIAGWRDGVVDFLTAGRVPAPSLDRVLATVLFTDIVGSTELARRLGDNAWRTLLDQHDRIATAEIERLGGRLIKTTGDGVLATFEGPSRGIACARAMAAALRPHDLQIRAGVHTGEIELRDNDIAGIGVVIASRICDLADAEDVLVSRTVKDLVTGSDIELADHGTHTLKGVADQWQLYTATPS
jgi:class 3 adenylate cyclase/pimeloyl-ACP methyl ester carboxylesterase